MKCSASTCKLAALTRRRRFLFLFTAAAAFLTSFSKQTDSLSVRCATSSAQTLTVTVILRISLCLRCYRLNRRRFTCATHVFAQRCSPDLPGLHVPGEYVVLLFPNLQAFLDDNKKRRKQVINLSVMCMYVSAPAICHLTIGKAFGSDASKLTRFVTTGTFPCSCPTSIAWITLAWLARYSFHFISFTCSLFLFTLHHGQSIFFRVLSAPSSALNTPQPSIIQNPLRGRQARRPLMSITSRNTRLLA